MNAQPDFSGFDAIEEAPAKARLDPRVFVEPNDTSAGAALVKEATRQRTAIALLRKIAKRVRAFAVPNAAIDAKDKLRQHKEGAVYGAPDLVLYWTGGVAFVEFKRAKTMPRPNQVDFLNDLARAEQHVAVCRTAEGLARWLRSIGAPVPEIQQ